DELAGDYTWCRKREVEALCGSVSPYPFRLSLLSTTELDGIIAEDGNQREKVHRHFRYVLYFLNHVENWQNTLKATDQVRPADGTGQCGCDRCTPPMFTEWLYSGEWRKRVFHKT